MDKPTLFHPWELQGREGAGGGGGEGEGDGWRSPGSLRANWGGARAKSQGCVLESSLIVS